MALIVAAGWSASTDKSQGVEVVEVSQDLAIGVTLTADDVRSARLDHPPDGALTSTDQAVGRRLGGAARRGEVLTDLRLVDTGGPDPGPGRVAIAVRPADPALVQLLQPGMTVTVIGVDADGSAATLCSDALVLAVLDETADRSGKSRPVLLGVPTADADRVTGGSLSADIALRFT